MASHVARMNAKTTANARIQWIAPPQARLATGLSGAIVTRHVGMRRKLELKNVIKEMVESGRQVEKLRRRWRRRNVTGFQNVTPKCARVDAAVGRNGASVQSLAEEGCSTGTAYKEGWTKR